MWVGVRTSGDNGRSVTFNVNLTSVVTPPILTRRVACEVLGPLERPVNSLVFYLLNFCFYPRDLHVE